ncbi:MAG: MOSC domain-containing protein [Saprospiraceae bacterium]|nr:MOSC domain-containing protein [Saprospiraceae bacterium]
MNPIPSAPTLSEIWIYPIKSLGGIALQVAVAEARGLRYDRRWMLVDDTGRFVTQREIPTMALLGTAIKPPYLSVFWKSKPQEKVQIPLEIETPEFPKLRVQIWGEQCSARVLSDGINQWFSHHLGQNLRLVYMPDTTRRRADGRYAPPGHHVSFADGFPYLIIGQASLDELNSRLAQTLPMNRFRPNFVFTGGQPFEEDSWKQFSIGQLPFQGVKPCARCIIPTTDQDTATRAAEPLKTLATFRKFGNRILFGQNVVWLGKEESVVRVGDVIRL